MKLLPGIAHLDYKDIKPEVVENLPKGKVVEVSFDQLTEAFQYWYKSLDHGIEDFSDYGVKLIATKLNPILFTEDIRKPIYAKPK